jgi:hypothetical protein
MLAYFKVNFLLRSSHVQSHEHDLVLVDAQVRQYVLIVLIQRSVVAVVKGLVGVPQLEHFLVKHEPRVRVLGLVGNIGDANLLERFARA